jgi:hypothetical protein
MKKILLAVSLLSTSAFAGDLESEITSVTNIRGNGAIEVCGIVKNQSKKTSLVTIKHDESSYTTLTDKDGKWCQLVKRWTFRGEVDAMASEL